MCLPQILQVRGDAPAVQQQFGVFAVQQRAGVQRQHRADEARLGLVGVAVQRDVRAELLRPVGQPLQPPADVVFVAVDRQDAVALEGLQRLPRAAGAVVAVATDAEDPRIIKTKIAVLISLINPTEFFILLWIFRNNNPSIFPIDTLPLIL